MWQFLVVLAEAATLKDSQDSGFSLGNKNYCQNVGKELCLGTLERLASMVENDAHKMKGSFIHKK